MRGSNKLYRDGNINNTLYGSEQIPPTLPISKVYQSTHICNAYRILLRQMNYIKDSIRILKIRIFLTILNILDNFENFDFWQIFDKFHPF